MSEIFGGIMAFPIHNTGHGAPFDEGMTLRDYFAAKAMQGFISYASNKGIYVPPDKELAASSYQLADAMMAYRDSGE
jgi:hypothetical protein